MIAFRVSVNGNCPVVASQPDWSVLSAIVSASRDNGPRGAEDYISVSLGGLRTHLTAISQSISVGLRQTWTSETRLRSK